MRPTVETRLEPVEDVGEYRRDDALLSHQLLGLEALDVAEGEILFGCAQPGLRRFARSRRHDRHGANSVQLETLRFTDRNAQTAFDQRPVELHSGRGG